MGNPVPCLHPQGGGYPLQKGPEGWGQDDLQGLQAQQQEHAQLQANDWTVHGNLQHCVRNQGRISGNISGQIYLKCHLNITSEENKKKKKKKKKKKVLALIPLL